MAIIETYHDYNQPSVVKEVKRVYEGRVVAQRAFNAQRNMSDTLDYSDYRHVDCAEALVYRGRIGKKYSFECQHEVDYELELHQRFIWEDCSNHFVWRGAPHRAIEIDQSNDPELIEDYAAWQQLQVELAEKARQQRIIDEENKRKRDALNEWNRPVRGKKMRVTRGRKVKVGTIGVVAYVHTNGGVLLKDPASWQDRNAPGTWVNGEYLENADDLEQ